MKRFSLLPILLLFLLVFLLLLTGYLAYQNTQLQKEVTRLSSQQTTPASSPTPESTGQITPTPRGQFCGGIAGVECPSGYTCQLEGNYPDAGGTCVASPAYTCPLNGWENCMPILTEEAKRECSAEAIAWKKKNCPNFQGVAQ